MRKLWQISALLALLLTAGLSIAKSGELYRYINDQGVTVLDRRVPPEAVARGYEVLDAQGRVRRTVPAALTPEERQAKRRAQAEQAERDAADATLLRLYSSVKDLDRAHARQIEQIDSLIASSETNILDLQIQRETLESRAAAAERAGREIDPRILDQLEEVDNESLRLQRLILNKEEEKLDVDAEYARQRERLKQLLADD
ncbi:hypothetical protein [Halopseudomonas salegens]|uniref:DUF4124 domain-containing protein n=1 Tax=Halopseudomonas salegens TaxID=1434072 RepID=A0A1H2HUE5_9GAMM|nr:hypothetical protein [Halopseudomonas salegens]SDU35434.1 hypothetical protein SAMN05216210_3315 [Halopseudomonas salegens]